MDIGTEMSLLEISQRLDKLSEELEKRRMTKSSNTESSVDRFKAITENMADIYERKNHDYGNSFNKSLDKFGIIASVVRLGDKMNRIESLAKGEAKVNDESIKDTLTDLANYAILTIMWLEEQ